MAYNGMITLMFSMYNSAYPSPNSNEGLGIYSGICELRPSGSALPIALAPVLHVKSRQQCLAHCVVQQYVRVLVVTCSRF